MVVRYITLKQDENGKDIIPTFEQTSIQGLLGNLSLRFRRMLSCAARVLFSPAKPVGSTTKITAVGRCYTDYNDR